MTDHDLKIIKAAMTNLLITLENQEVEVRESWILSTLLDWLRRINKERFFFAENKKK